MPRSSLRFAVDGVTPAQIRDLVREAIIQGDSDGVALVDEFLMTVDRSRRRAADPLTLTMVDRIASALAAYERGEVSARALLRRLAPVAFML